MRQQDDVFAVLRDHSAWTVEMSSSGGPAPVSWSSRRRRRELKTPCTASMLMS